MSLVDNDLIRRCDARSVDGTLLRRVVTSAFSDWQRVLDRKNFLFVRRGRRRICTRDVVPSSSSQLARGTRIPCRPVGRMR